MISYRYSKSYCGDATVVQSSHLHSGISHTGKMTSLYWNNSQYICKLVVITCIANCFNHQPNAAKLAIFKQYFDFLRSLIYWCSVSELTNVGSTSNEMNISETIFCWLGTVMIRDSIINHIYTLCQTSANRPHWCFIYKSCLNWFR